MKILFLDVDGVLNSEETFRARHALWKETGLKTKDERFAWPLGHLDESLISRLNTIVEQTNCEIVLSSSWRIICNLPDFRDWMKEKGFKYSNRIIDKTPSIGGEDNDRRGNEIKLWLEKNKEGLGVEKFAIVDDDSFDIIGVWPQNFVHIDGRVGLQDVQVEKVINLLK